MVNAVRVKNLKFSFSHKDKTLNNINLDFEAGKITGLIGPSGAGKTTLIRCIVGRQRFKNGSVTIFNLPAGSPRLRSQVSYMTQQLSVYQDLTVMQNMDYFGIILGLKTKARKASIDSILEMVDMQKFAKTMVSKLSGGQKQRVSLAIALLGKPKLLVLDEPTVGLDPVLRENIWRLFRHLKHQGISIIISSHAMDEASRCDQLVLMREGSVIAHGTPSALCDRTNSTNIEDTFLKLVGAGN